MGAGQQEVFGEYRLVRRLAVGGMAEVFLATLERRAGFAKTVVIKRILPQYASDPRFVTMFCDEAVVAARLTHPNLAQVYDFGAVADQYFISMEYVDGVDLRRLLRAAKSAGRSLEAAEIAALGEGMCRGLSYAHNVSHGGAPLDIVHRDVSPHNVMVDRSGTVKVMDFGIAQAAVRATVTATGVLKGKLAYMAPEQAAGLPVNKLTDQFAVGLVLWELWTGCAHYAASEAAELMGLALSGSVRPPGDLRPGLPAPLESVILRSLSRQPSDRYPDLADMERQLGEFRYSLGASGRAALDALVAQLVPEPCAADGARAGTRSLRAGPRCVAPCLSGREVTPSGGGSAGRDPAPVPSPRGQHADALPIREPRPAPGVAGTTGCRARAPRSASAVRGRWTRLGWVGVVATLVFAAASAARMQVRRAGDVVAGPRLPPDVPMASDVAPMVHGASGLARGDGRPAVSAPETSAPPLNGIEAALGGPPSARLAPLPVASMDRGSSARPEAEGRFAARPTRQAGDGAGVPAGADAEPVPADGFLSLRLRGLWSEVYLGEKRLGVTPLRRVPIPAGRHVLRLVNEVAGYERLVEITVGPQQHVRQSVR